MTDDEYCKDLVEILEELSPYTPLIIELLDKEIETNEFFTWKYHTEHYYNEVIRLKKVRNLLWFLLR